MTNCNYKSFYTNSGDRGADIADHDRHFHPDHEHVWGPSTYEWEARGTTFIVPGSRDGRASRLAPPTRCTVCGVKPEEDRSGHCPK